LSSTAASATPHGWNDDGTLDEEEASMSDSTTPRIPPQAPEEWAEDLRAALSADLGDRPRLGELNIFTTLARHPELFKTWMPFASYLLIGATLPFADRELLILRTGYNCRSPYEWGQHVRIATDGGIERDLIERVAAGPDAPGWNERQSLLLRAADELHANAVISDRTWKGLEGELDERQLIELPFLVGQYHLVAFVLNSLAVQPEPGLEPLP
jgi:alkylhydroperoxidase family enzyme